ncbi:MAG: TauD/TfdA dioxygenase family protein [Pseudonocardia sp.]
MAAEHPVVRTHPVTGRKSIFVNQEFTSHIVGLRSSESKALLRMLFDTCHLVDYQLRCRWRTGTIAVWDNRCVQHTGSNDRVCERVIHRITIAGDRPV